MIRSIISKNYLIWKEKKNQRKKSKKEIIKLIYLKMKQNHLLIILMKCIKINKNKLQV